MRLPAMITRKIPDWINLRDERNNKIRITSYNVCYTKLLRAAATATIKITIRVCILFHQNSEGGSQLKDQHRQAKRQYRIKCHGKRTPFPGTRLS